MAPPQSPISQVDLLMEQIAQSREIRRQRQLDFYSTFLPSKESMSKEGLVPVKALSRAAVAKLLEDHRKSYPARMEAHARSVFLQREIRQK